MATYAGIARHQPCKMQFIRLGVVMLLLNEGALLSRQFKGGVMNELQLQEWADTHTKKLEDRITELEKEVEDWKGNVGDLEGVCSEYRDEIQRLTAEVARLDGLLKESNRTTLLRELEGAEDDTEA